MVKIPCKWPIAEVCVRAVNALFRKLYWPLCRVYSRRLADKPADSLYKFLFSIEFYRQHRYWPNLTTPFSFSEKVATRMLYDRDPFLTLISDKLHVRDYVAKRAGSQYLVPLLWSGDSTETIPFNDLPQKFVIKTNHGCGYNIIVRDRTQIDWELTKRKLNKWIRTNFGNDTMLGAAWAYTNIDPRIMVEALLDDNGKLPVDYKFYCFSGRVEFLLMMFDRYGNRRQKHFDRDFNALDLWKGVEQYEGDIERPDNYREMLEFAERLSDGMDFIRVDAYSVGNRVFFGELTCYPAGSMSRFVPRKYDVIFGEKWVETLDRSTFQRGGSHYPLY